MTPVFFSFIFFPSNLQNTMRVSFTIHVLTQTSLQCQRHCTSGSEEAEEGELQCYRTEQEYNIPLRIGMLFIVLATSAIGKSRLSKFALKPWWFPFQMSVFNIVLTNTTRRVRTDSPLGVPAEGLGHRPEDGEAVWHRRHYFHGFCSCKSLTGSSVL